MIRSPRFMLTCLVLLALPAGEAAAVTSPVSATAAAPSAAGGSGEPSAAVGAAARRPRYRARRPGNGLGRRGATAPVEAANHAALREPDRMAYVNAAQVYPWAEGALYRLYAAPEQVSDIALQPGEALVSVAAGDTVRWVIGDTTSGSGGGRRVHVLVKPSVPGLRTNLLVSTDRRVYHLALESTARTAMASISWSYPEEALLALRRSEAEPQAVADAVPVDSLDFDYAISGDSPPWRPLRAFDDGRQVFIQFPAGVARGEAPPLFITGEQGKPELVNYRMHGAYYVVDRLFAAAELRLGGKKQQVVRIVRGRKGRRARAS
jgi:P-type conjugative transfer protein TrbG